MNKDNWEAVKKFYVETFNVTDDLVDLVADSEILHMCATGASNLSISNTLDIDIEIVKTVISSVYDFDGWATDLEINPYKEFEKFRDRGQYLFVDFDRHIESVSPYSGVPIMDMFRSCKSYERIKINIDSNWK